MGLHEESSSNKTYLSIIGGKITKRITEAEYNTASANNEEGYSVRELEKGPNKGTNVYEKQFRGISGRIISAKVESSDYGQRVVIELLDGDVYVLGIPLDSRYANDIMFKWPNIDFDLDVYISPWDFEDDEGKRRTGVTLKQDDTKVDRFWTKDNPGELPPAKKKKKGKETVWDFDEQQTFLVEYFEHKAKEIGDPTVVEPSAKEQALASNEPVDDYDDELGF